LGSYAFDHTYSVFDHRHGGDESILRGGRDFASASLSLRIGSERGPLRVVARWGLGV
jgi:hypothetical protein